MSSAAAPLCALLALTALGPSVERACSARPPLAACTAAPPAPGEVFSGPVMQVNDGRSVCVASGPLPRQWIQVTIADADAPASRGALMAAAFARQVSCIAVGPASPGVRAICRRDGISIGRLSATAEARAQSAAWR